MKVVRVPSPQEFDSIVGTLRNGTQPLFVLLFGTEDAKTGESWCPDCVVADPLIRSQVSKVPNSILVECPVGRREEYKNKPDHPYRVHEEIKLKAIPTLFHWTKDGPRAALVEEECADAKKLEEFMRTSAVSA